MLDILIAALLATAGNPAPVGAAEVCPGVQMVEFIIDGEVVAYHKDILTGSAVPPCDYASSDSF